MLNRTPALNHQYKLKGGISKLAPMMGSQREKQMRIRIGEKSCMSCVMIRLLKFIFTGSDYINASYIRDYRGEQSFIASQAPQVCTIDDMWRMIWQEQVNVIVMLTKLKVIQKIFYLKLIINGNNIALVTNFNFMGLTLSSTISWNH